VLSCHLEFLTSGHSDDQGYLYHVTVLYQLYQVHVNLFYRIVSYRTNMATVGVKGLNNAAVCPSD